MPAPIILQDQSGLAEGIAMAGSALGSALGQRMQEKRLDAKRQQHGSILDQTLGSLPGNASPLEVTQALTAAVNQGVPPDMAQQYGTLYATLQKSQANTPPGPEQISTMSNLFKKFGMPEEVAARNAELWANLTTGGQTEMAKLLVDQIARNQFLPTGQQVDYSAMTNQGPIPEQASAVEEVETFNFPSVNVFEDRTPKERAQLKSQLLKDNNDFYQELSEKVRSTDNELMRYNQLERLNESGRLPEDLGMLNINWTTGDIRFPRLANPETQQFVKTINDFTVAAKDSFGAVVSNFELGAFMKRLPTLANSEGGRRAIIKQMQSVKKLDRLYEDSIKQVYDHYGMQKIDRATAERIAEDLRADDEKRLKQEFAESVDAQKIYEARELAPEGKIPARAPDGKIVYIWQHQADKAEKKGYKPL